MSKTGNWKYDLTQGPILNRLLMVALPIIGTQFMLMSYNLTDMFLLGRVGSDAVAASAAAGMYLWLAGGVMLIGRMGAEIGVAQNMGRGDLEAARKYSLNSVFIAAALGVIYAALCMALRVPLIGFFGIRESHVVLDAQKYLFITSIGTPAVLVSAATAGTFNGSGNSRVPFLINTVGLVLNIILDPIFIFLLDMGVIGAAIATTIAQIAVCILSLLALTKKSDRPFPHYSFRETPEIPRIAGILRWSLPIALESILFTFFSMLVSRLVAGYGAHAMAVHRVGSQIESLCWLTCIGFSTALTAFVGQNYGAGRWDRIKACCRAAFLSIVSWGIVVIAIMIWAGEPLFRLFLPDPELVATGKAFLRILALCQVFSCLEAASSGFFRGLGKTVPPSLVSIVSNALRVPLAWALGRGPLGLHGIWLGVTLGAVLRGLWLFLWFLREFRRDLRKPSTSLPSGTRN